MRITFQELVDVAKRTQCCQLRTPLSGSEKYRRFLRAYRSNLVPLHCVQKSPAIRRLISSA